MKRFIQFHDRTHRALESKMERLVAFVMPLKVFGAMIFTGFIILYMMSGVLYAYFSGNEFNYTIPFTFILQGLILAALISLLWGIFFSDVIVKKWRYFSRLIVFSISLMVLLAVCLLTFIAIPVHWACLWLITNGIIGIGVVFFSIISEIRFKSTGRRYTEMLNLYKASKFNS